MLAPVQRGIWIASRQRPDADPYLVLDLSRVYGAIDPEILHDCLADLAKRHDALRISITGAEDPAQRVNDCVDVDLEFLDLSGRPGAEREAMSVVEERGERPFDLAMAPLWRVMLVRLRADEHLLLLTIHHLICDEWSLNLLHRELGTQYLARATGDLSHCSPSPSALSYCDFAQWQADRFSSPAGDRSLKYWHRAMQGIPHELDLPVDFSRAGGATRKGHIAGWTPTTGESERFSELADRLEASPFLVMVTLFGVVLARHSGQPDLAVGTTVSGRSSTETERMVGYITNLLPIPIRLRDEPTFSEAVRATKRAFLGLLDHQDIAFDRIVTELGASRPDLRQPLCQAYVSWSEGGENSWSLGQARADPVARRTGSAKAEIALAGVRRHGEFRFELIGEAGLFRIDTLHTLMDHFREATRGAIADSGKSVLALDLAGSAEAGRLDQWSGSARREDAYTTIPRLFDEAATAHADRTAVVDSHTALTYAQLSARSGQWASELARLRVSADTVVGVAIERSAEMVAAVLGILRAGGAYMALSADGPADYNTFCVAESKAAVVVATRGTSGLLGDIGCPVVLSEDLDGVVAPTGWPDGRPGDRCMPDSLAFVSFTSGSTGTPKCVGITHRNIARISYRSERILYGPEATFIQLAPLGFDVSAIELWACLLHGGRLVVPPHGRFDIPELASILRDQRVTTMVITTALFSQLVEQDIEALAAVGQVLVGGETAPPSVFNTVVSAAPTRGLCLTNCYGPTENTCITTIAVISDRAGASVPIGTPVQGSTVHVLDPSLERVPVGVAGELFTGGVGVSRGYLNDAGLTAARFLPDPYSDVPGARMYRTGDLARWRADGQLDFLGRVDRQVKVRGFRVEPGEIEARLMEHPDVSVAVVVAQAGADGHKQLVAYVTPAGETEVIPARLRSFVAMSLPEHMIPAVITAIERIPMTPHGKVDRNALPAPQLAVVSARHRSPVTPTQAVLAEAWSVILGLDEVSVDANFFELGGDSILAIRIAARVRDAGIRIFSTDLFTTQTVSELAAAIDARSADVATTEIHPVPAGVAVLSPIQQWFADRYGPENHFNQSVWLRSDEPLDETLLRDAFEALVRHHDSLRLRLRSAGGRWTQEVRSSVVQDLVTVAEVDDRAGEREAAIERYSAALQRSLDVSAGMLIQSLLVPHPSGRDDLVVVAHHLAMDTVSWEVLVRHLTVAYRQLQAGRTPLLPSETVSFIDWTAALRESAAVPGFEDFGRRWQEIDERRAETAIARSGDAGVVRQAGRVRAELSDSSTRDLRRPVSACSVDITTVLLTALARTLAEWTGESSWVIETEGHGRDALGAHVDLSESLGWFTALFPVGLAIDTDATVAGQLRAIHRQLRAQPPGYTYGICRYLKRDERLRSPVRSDVSFNYHGQLAQPEQGRLLQRIGGGIGGDLGAELQRPNSLEFNAAAEFGRLRVELSYPADHFARREMQRVVDRFAEHCRLISGAF